MRPVCTCVRPSWSICNLTPRDLQNQPAVQSYLSYFVFLAAEVLTKSRGGDHHGESIDLGGAAMARPRCQLAMPASTSGKGFVVGGRVIHRRGKR
jgi:hypothetical protein